MRKRALRLSDRGGCNFLQGAAVHVDGPAALARAIIHVEVLINLNIKTIRLVAV